MQKVRVHEIAKELGIKSKDIVEKAKELGLDVKTASSAVSEAEAENLLNYVISGKSAEPTPVPQEKPKTVEKSLKPVKSLKPDQEKKPEPPKQATITKPEPLKQPDTPPVEKPVKPEPVNEKPAPQKTTEQAAKTEEPRPVEVAKTVSESAPAAKTAATTGPGGDSRETLAQATVKKRRGLVIVKKKKPVEEPKPVEEKQPEEKKAIGQLTAESVRDKLMAATSTMDQEAQEERRKKKKIKKQLPSHSRKEHEQKIDILAERPLNERSFLDDEDNEVMLMDLSGELNKRTEEEEVKKTQDKVKVTRQNRFMEQRGIRRGGRKKRRKKEEIKEEVTGMIEIPEDIRVYEFADTIGKSVGEVIKVLFNLGMMITKNDFLDEETLEILADEFDLEVSVSNPLESLDYMSEYEGIEDEGQEERPPVVTIMGHVDHGKTSLLDYIRDSRVAAGEAGGITQHIGAYMVDKGGRKISFIDTPGHEAFTEMRSRGAQVTDIAIIVVAADDGVQPQTEEALNHAKAAEVPIIIAINKIDKPEANPDMVKSQMAERNFTPVDWGGEYEFVPVSAKTGEGVDDLLETVLLQSEIMELTANPHKEAKAVVVESSLEKGKGPVATIIIQDGTLKVGDSVVVDTEYGRVRALIDDRGRNIQQIGPSEMAVVTGLGGVPDAGSVMISVTDDATARQYAEKRAEHVRQKELSKSTKVSFDELSAMVAEGKLKSLNVIIKSDVAGSLEAIKGSLEKLKNDEVKINVVHAAVGGITESDLTLAGASDNTLILGFNVRPTGTVKEKAKTQGIQIKTYTVIYDMLDDVKALLTGMMSPVVEEEATGQAEVRDTFVVSKVGTVAGCFVTDGVINRGIKVRLIREGVVVYEGMISSLKRFKDDVREVAKGYECGIMIDGFNDVKVGDYMETFKEVERQREL